ncbi:MAG: phosphoesterase [Planctomycetaceae bacterium]|jgi:predicted NUDIX family phosphoesterase|nr:phosphoesterase [Planctomycetaceae bacterium]
MSEEHVLVIPTKLFHEIGCFQGFCADIDRYRNQLLAPENFQFMPRSAAESSPQFKQLIPYMIFRHTDSSGAVRIFQYVRGKGTGESRLRQKRSIGVGGHIAAEDRLHHSGNVYREGMLRELREEVVLHTSFTEQCVGLINDDSSDVGRVHLGIVHTLDVAEPEVFSNEPELIESGFMPLETLRSHRTSMESWSSLCLDALFIP